MCDVTLRNTSRVTQSGLHINFLEKAMNLRGFQATSSACGATTARIKRAVVAKHSEIDLPAESNKARHHDVFRFKPGVEGVVYSVDPAGIQCVVEVYAERRP